MKCKYQQLTIEEIFEYGDVYIFDMLEELNDEKLWKLIDEGFIYAEDIIRERYLELKNNEKIMRGIA